MYKDCQKLFQTAPKGGREKERKKARKIDREGDRKSK